MTSRPDDDDLEERLDELEETLTRLRSELESQSSSRFPRPPSPTDLLRFTEQYTIPTLIAFLEAAIRSLELLQRALRLADPGRAARAESEEIRGGVDRVRSEATDQLADSLSDLRRALSGAELPESTPPETRRLLDDARELTDEIENRLHDAREGRTQGRRSRDGDGGVRIDITDELDDEPPEDDADEPDGPEVDVDSELESIKKELSVDEEDKPDEEPDDDAGDADDTDDTDDTDDEGSSGEESDSPGEDGDSSDSAVPGSEGR